MPSVVCLSADIYLKLLTHAHDADEAARVAIAASLREIGAAQPIFALTAAVDFVRINKVSESVRPRECGGRHIAFSE